MSEWTKRKCSSKNIYGGSNNFIAFCHFLLITVVRRPVAKQRQRKKQLHTICCQISFPKTEKNNCAAKEKPCFLWGPTVSRVEAGSNTSIVTLRVVRGDKMGTHWQIRSKIWSRVLQDLDLRVPALERPSSTCTSTLQTCTLVKENAPKQKNKK
jgi:hypothetical protein